MAINVIGGPRGVQSIGEKRPDEPNQTPGLVMQGVGLGVQTAGIFANMSNTDTMAEAQLAQANAYNKNTTALAQNTTDSVDKAAKEVRDAADKANKAQKSAEKLAPVADTRTGVGAGQVGVSGGQAVGALAGGGGTAASTGAAATGAAAGTAAGAGATTAGAAGAASAATGAATAGTTAATTGAAAAGTAASGAGAATSAASTGLSVLGGVASVGGGVLAAAGAGLSGFLDSKDEDRGAGDEALSIGMAVAGGAIAGSAFGGVGAAVGAGVGAVAYGIGRLFSDERLKEDIAPTSRQDFIDMFNSLQSFDYKYKDQAMPGTLPGTRTSVMAQDLQKTKLGKQIVEKQDNGYLLVDYNKAMPIMLSALAEQQHQISDLETLLGKKNKKRGS